MPKTLDVASRVALAKTGAATMTKAANTLRNLLRLTVANVEQRAKIELQGESLKCQLAKAFRDYAGKGWEDAKGDSAQGAKVAAMVKDLYGMAKDKSPAAYNAARKMLNDTKAFARDGYKPKVKAKRNGNKGRKPGEKDSFPVYFEKQVRPILERYYTTDFGNDEKVAALCESAMENVRIACALFNINIAKEMQMAPKPKADKPKAKAKAK